MIEPSAIPEPFDERNNMALQVIKRVFHRMSGRRPHFGALEAGNPSINLEDLAARDRWFYDHFIKVPKILTEFLARVIELKPSIVLDFGCGQGLMAKGVARFTWQVHGVDIIPAFERVEERFQETFGGPDLFPPVKLRRVRPGKPLPYGKGYFDAVYAWSVFEHVADVPYALNEIHRVLRPGGAFFLQISPLYFSAQGGHLWNILDEPWIHLRLSREELLERVRHTDLDGIPQENQHDAFQGESAEAYRAGVIACHDTLNRVTVGQLVGHVREAGFTIVEQLTMRDSPKDVPADLLELYPEEDLRTDQVVLLMTR
jgi:SAM-dependent methyltransferase